MAIRLSFLFASTLLFGSVQAQVYATSSGEEALTARVIADVFRERVGADSAVTIIVLWRGQEFWMRQGAAGHSGGQTGSGRTALATARYTSTRGGITRLIAFERNNHIVIDNRDTLRLFADSTVIIMVNRVDSVGGAPVVTSMNIPRLPAAAVSVSPPAVVPSREEYARLMQEFATTGRVDNKFSQFLNTIPAVREFLRE
jgi:hypothetical protein